VWSLVAIAWGVVFVAAAERARPAVPAVDQGSTTSTPLWVTASGGVVLVVVLLVVGMFLAGTSLGGVIGHAPPAGGHR
jgi:hypothetical protein